MTDAADIPRRVDELLCRAVGRGASDIHVEPLAAGGEVRFRVDGLLQKQETLSADVAAAFVARLMVMANLLTYRRDVPQEGRATTPVPGVARPIDLRVSIMPTTHGLRAAVRLPAELSQPRSLDALGLDAGTRELIDAFVRADGGVLAIVGPAGSGKTTTAYAVLETIAAAQPGLSIVSLEDPVERDLPGVTQIQVQPFGQLTYATALRSMLRQDPQVLMLGEVRDAETASVAIQGGLSGHRLVCTLHAADAAQAVARLLEMGLEPYQVAGSLFGVIAQRLLRRKTPDGYAGRLPVGEAVRIDPALRRQISARVDSDDLRVTYQSMSDFVSLPDSAARRVAAGETDAAEVWRVLGTRV
ncbi:MAG TPA: ATPase, T2SS/T4P/T4SS family [Tepidisphaeraceae bacterium]|jgi:type II secretory ATPase GspE/PulE/Tfp pilus assembly ATPase PilB-like protein